MRPNCPIGILAATLAPLVLLSNPPPHRAPPVHWGRTQASFRDTGRFELVVPGPIPPAFSRSAFSGSDSRGRHAPLGRGHVGTTIISAQ